MLDLRPCVLNIRLQEHNRRVNRVNRDGWLLSSAPRAGREVGLGTILGVVTALVALRKPVQEVPGVTSTIDALATENGLPGPA